MTRDSALAARAFVFGKDVEAFEEAVQGANAMGKFRKEMDLWRKKRPAGELHNLCVFIRSSVAKDALAECAVGIQDNKVDGKLLSGVTWFWLIGKVD